MTNTSIFPRLIIAIASSAFLIGCNASNPVKPDAITVAAPDLNNTYWQLDYMSGQQVSLITNASIAFEQGRVSGSGGCNLYFADYQAEAGQLTVDKIVTTKRLCTADISVREQTLFKLLRNVDHYGLNELGNLTIYAANLPQPMVLKPVPRNSVRLLASSNANH